MGVRIVVSSYLFLRRLALICKDPTPIAPKAFNHSKKPTLTHPVQGTRFEAFAYCSCVQRVWPSWSSTWKLDGCAQEFCDADAALMPINEVELLLPDRLHTSRKIGNTAQMRLQKFDAVSTSAHVNVFYTAHHQWTKMFALQAGHTFKLHETCWESYCDHVNDHQNHFHKQAYRRTPVTGR